MAYIYIYSYQLQSNRMTITRTEMWKEIRNGVGVRTLRIHFKHPIGRNFVYSKQSISHIESYPFPCNGLAMSELRGCKDWVRKARKKCIRYSNIINTIVCDGVQCVCLLVCLSFSLFFAWTHCCAIPLTLLFYIPFPFNFSSVLSPELLLIHISFNITTR